MEIYTKMKNLIQRIATNAGCLIIGAALAIGLSHMVNHQPVQQEKKEERFYENPYYPCVYYRITNQVYRKKLEEIKVDKNGDRIIDEVIVFFRRRPGVTLSENGIGIYKGSYASDLLGNRRKHILLPKCLETSEDYRKAAMEVLKVESYPYKMIEGFDFDFCKQG